MSQRLAQVSENRLLAFTHRLLADSAALGDGNLGSLLPEEILNQPLFGRGEKLHSLAQGGESTASVRGSSLFGPRRTEP